MMKTNSKFYLLLIISTILLSLILPETAMCQDEPEKLSARLRVDYYNINNTTHKVIATVMTRGGRIQSSISDNRSYTGPAPVPNTEVKFYFEIDGFETVYAGSSISNEQGKATLVFEGDIARTIDTVENFLIIAAVEGSDVIRDVDNEVQIRKAYTSMTAVEEDSIRTINFSVTVRDSTGHMVPAEYVPCKIVVQRLFGFLPVSDDYETTNRQGIFDMEFPYDIPGDTDGKLTVIAKVEDHDEFGNLEYQMTLPWGQRVEFDRHDVADELFSSSSNISRAVVAIITLMVAGIVAVIVYIIVQLFEIKNLGSKKEMPG